MGFERILSDLGGTLKNVFRIGRDVLIKNNNGKTEIRDYEDTEYTDLKSKRLIVNNNQGTELVIDTDFILSGGIVPTYESKEFQFTFETVSPFSLMEVFVGERIRKAGILIESVFDEGIQLSIGHTGNQEGLLKKNDNIPSMEGYYETSPNFLYGGDDYIRFYITGTPTMGSGYIFLEIERIL